MRQVCQVVACVGLFTAGCGASHGLGEDVDAGVLADAARPALDAATPSPVPVPVPPTECVREDVRATRICERARTSAPLEVLLDGCLCDERLSCVAEMTGPGSLNLRTSVCPSLADCDGCVPSIAAICDMPTLSPGLYDISINDVPAAAPIFLGAGGRLTDECVMHTVAPPVGPELLCRWQNFEDRVGLQQRTCYPTVAPAGELFTIEVEQACGSCFDRPGSCVVSLTGGNNLALTGLSQICHCPSCGACADVCTPIRVPCRVGPLEPGVYNLETAAGWEPLLVVGDVLDPTEVCVDASL